MDINNLQNHFLLLQINDSLFPIGAYSHSYGLETYIQKQIVFDVKSAYKYIENRLKYNFLYTDLLAVRLAYEAMCKHDINEIDKLENIMEVSKLPKEVREASQKIGKRFIKTILYMDLFWENDYFFKYLEARKNKSTCQPCAYGVFCSCMHMDKTEVLANYLYAQTSSMITTCVKTVPLSQSDGQKILASFSTLFIDLLSTVEKLDANMLCLSTLGFDLRSIQHEYLYSRLYMS